MPSRLEERDPSGLRPSLLLSSNNAAAGPSRRSAGGTRVPLYGLPGVTTSTHSLPPRGRATPPIASSSAAPMAAENDLGSGFVRSTLTAPDNMLRRQALEREKERKAKKIVKKQERARQAMEALATGGAGAGPSSSTMTQASRSGQRAAISPAPPPASSSSRPRTPVETSQQTSASPRRSPSPRRRARPAARAAEPAAETIAPSTISHASQAIRAAESQSIPTEPSSMPGSFPEPSAARPDQPAAVRARRQRRVRPPVTMATTSAATDRSRMAHRASLRRHNIYQEIANMGLPGVESASEASEVEQQGQDISSLFSSDLGRAAAPPISEDPPPPFPEGGARPPSPPRAPPIRVDGQEYDWTSDEERTWADYRRRVPDSPPPAFESEDENTRNSARPRSGDDDDASSTTSSNENQAVVTPSAEQLAWEDDVRRGLSLEDRIARLEARRRRLEGPQEQSESVAASVELSTEQPASAVLSEALPETRSSSQTISAPAAEPVVAQVPKPVAPTTPAPMIVLPPGAGLNTDGALSRPSLPHQTSASRVARNSATTTGPTRRRRRTEPRNAGEATLAPPVTTALRGGATAIRPRPSSESHSRFRDDAAAAAERRRLAWGAAAGPLEVPKASAWRTERQPPAPIEVRPTSAPTAMPGSFGQERDEAEVATGETQDDSDDSAEEWAAEAAAFEALRQAAEKIPAVVDSDAEEGSGVDEDMPGGLGVYRSPMGRLQDTLPKAPPPLALGRSRNAGLAYDASDSDDSPDEGRSAFESGSEDSLTDEDQVVRHHNPRWQTPEDDGVEAASIPSGSTLVRTSSSKSMPSRTQVVSDTARLSSPSTSSLSAADKGKQAVRGSTGRPTQASGSTSRVRSSTSPTVAKSTQAQSIREAGPSGLRSAEPARAPATKPLPVPGTAAHQVNPASTSPVLPSAPSLRRQSSNSSIWQSSLPGAPGRETHAEVTDRLKGLFGASLATHSSGSQSQGVDSAAKQPGVPQQAPLRRKSSSRSTAESKSGKPTEIESPVARQPSLDVNKTASGLPDDQQLRRDALSDIAKLSRQASGSERSSLAALERMLTDSLRIDSAGSSQPPVSSSTTARRQPPPIPPRDVQPLPTAVSSLTRSGSVYINPRSSFAPLPRQTRLPAITDDTRHFPRTRASTLLTGEESRDAPVLPPRPPVGLRIAGLMAKFEQSAGQANRPERLDAQDIERRSPEVVQTSTAASGSLTGIAEPASSRGEAAASQDHVPVPSIAQQEAPPTPKRRPPPPPPARLTTAPMESSTEDLPLRPFSVAAASSAGVETSLPASSSLDSGLSSRSNQTNLPGGLFRTNSQTDRARRAAWAALTRNAASIEGQETSSDRPSSGEEVIADVVRRAGTLRARPPPPLPESIRRAGTPASETASGSDERARSRQNATIQELNEPQLSIAEGRPLSRASEASTARFGRRPRPLPMPPSTSASPVPVATLIESTRREQPIVDTPAAALVASNDDSTAPAGQPTANQPTRSASLGFTDLDLLASRLETDPSSGYDTAVLLSSFLGPADPRSTSLTPSELASIPLGTIYIEKRRTTKEGKVKTKLACLGLRVDRCGICLTQFKEGQGAYVLGCLHVFHGKIDPTSGNGPDCAREWFRNSRRCPTCRAEALGRGEEVDPPSGPLIEL